MTLDDISTTSTAKELGLSCVIPATPEKVFRAWTDPELVKVWYVPAPWSVASATLDVRPGGRSLIVMRSPDGQEFPAQGVYLEVVQGKRLVFTDAFVSGWEVSEKPFMTVTLTFEPCEGGTRYTARVQHWSEQSRAEHEEMGFHEGWSQCALQLAELVKTL